MMRWLCFLLLPLGLLAAPSPEKLRALYGGLQPGSVAQYLALYHLYPESPEGRRAFQEAIQMLCPKGTEGAEPLLARTLPFNVVEALVALVNKQPYEELPVLSHEELSFIEKMAAHLPNRTLKGATAQSEAEVLGLPPEAIDLARGLFLSELGNTPEALQQMRVYEAMLDLMALQLLAKTTLEEKPEQKIRALNCFVFETMNFRFPPHSEYVEQIHRYTFLPSVLDTRRGVCLGVSILYTCLAQRLGIHLELVTPPGHIFVRYREGEREINIETTLRGVHIESEEYLGVETRALEQRNLKAVIGLAHINEAAVYFQEGDYEKALMTYQKAQPYLPDDPQLKELMGYSYLLLGKKECAEAFLQPLKDYQSPYSVGENTLLQDVLSGRADARCLAALFHSREETAEDLYGQRAQIEDILKVRPEFRAGWMHLGGILVALHRIGEALECFQRYHLLDEDNASAEYSLALLYAQRMHYLKAWEHLKNAENILTAEEHRADCVRELRRELTLRCAEPKRDNEDLYKDRR